MHDMFKICWFMGENESFLFQRLIAEELESVGWGTFKKKKKVVDFVFGA